MYKMTAGLRKRPGKPKWEVPKAKQIFYYLKYAAKSRISPKYKKPLICGLKLTYRCNLKCRHCPFWRKEEPLQLGYRETVKILEKLHAEGVRIVIFEGGEPLLWNDRKEGKNISDIIEYAKKHFFSIGITTNGTIPFKTADPDIMFVSIDGLEETHDHIRGESFKKIIKNIGDPDNRSRIIANICISKLNFSEVPGLVKFLAGKVYGITIQFFYPYSRMEDLSLDKQQKTEVLKKLSGLKKEGYPLLDSYDCLRRMDGNTWRCHDFLVSSVDPDGKIIYGCYLKGRAEDISCSDCGFAAHCEISMAYQFNPGALQAARRIFWDN